MTPLSWSYINENWDRYGPMLLAEYPLLKAEDVLVSPGSDEAGAELLMARHPTDAAEFGSAKFVQMMMRFRVWLVTPDGTPK